MTLTAPTGQTGLNAFQDGKSIAVQSLKDHLGEDNIKRLINYILRYLSEAPSPPSFPLHGYLAHKKTPPLRTLQ